MTYAETTRTRGKATTTDSGPRAVDRGGRPGARPASGGQRPAPGRGRSGSAEPARLAALAAGMVAGLLVGVGIAMLATPWSGVETRHRLSRQGRRVKRKAGDAWDDLRYELERAGKNLLRARRAARNGRARSALAPQRAGTDALAD